ncbi:hypothetical protein Pcinc_038365 [Petrolisthes cinctipes]|uniref:C-type lectin domain-containing protein n=1 Tax=Petrolisthes cinctipes TaxID=88211 RepID=A0AAE1BQT4_PETCI|nr:hypothetical protein Pcinc_038365 [Petrolisthes cinctipes]
MFIILPEAYILLYILGSNFFSCSAHSVPPTSNKQTIEESSLAVNQLAILHLLNGEVTGTECERMSRLDSEEKEELRNLREEVATLRQTQATLRDNMREEFNNSVDIRQCDDDPEAQGEPTYTESELRDSENRMNEDHFFHHEGETFFLNRGDMTWFEGRKWCQARGGELAHPSGNLRTFLNKAASMVWRGWFAWIGASYSSESEQWQWVTGLSIQGDLRWFTGRPNTPLTRYNCLAVSFKALQSKGVDEGVLRLWDSQSHIKPGWIPGNVVR